MDNQRLTREAVLRVGEVVAVSGRKIFVAVDYDKNLSELFFDGDIIRNVGVGSYVNICKGFLNIIGRVEGENADNNGSYAKLIINDITKRTLIISLAGYIDNHNNFFGGTKELPLVGNEVFLLTQERSEIIHNLVVKDTVLKLSIAKSEFEDYNIALPIDGLMNSHIAIFGNTGSGKSNTLASIYTEFIKIMSLTNDKKFKEKCKILLFDFNNEYIAKDCLSSDKSTYQLTTRGSAKEIDAINKIPLGKDALFNDEILSILADATEKTQKPFLKRVLRFLKNAENNATFKESGLTTILQAHLKAQVEQVLMMSDKTPATLLLDYLVQILDYQNTTHDLKRDLEWHDQNKKFMYKNNGYTLYFQSSPSAVFETNIYKAVDKWHAPQEAISLIIAACYMTLIDDVLANRAQNDHIAPAINKLKGKSMILSVYLTPQVTAKFSTNQI